MQHQKYTRKVAYTDVHVFTNGNPITMHSHSQTHTHTHMYIHARMHARTHAHTLQTLKKVMI